MDITLGEFIKIARKKQKMTQSELAEIIGKKPITIRKYENNEIELSLEVLSEIAKALNINILDLLEIKFDGMLFHRTEETSIEREQDKEKEDDLNHSADKNYSITIPKEEINKIYPMNLKTLKTEIDFLSNPNIEMIFNYSYNELAKKGYDELLINAIEKAIRTTLEDIETHLNNGDLFDGVGAWISKDSPLYDVIKNHEEEK